MRMVKQQAAGPQPGSFLLTMRLCLLLVGKAMGRMKREPYQLVSIHWLKMTIGLVKFIFCRHEILQNSQESTYARITLSIKLQAFSLQFY